MKFVPGTRLPEEVEVGVADLGGLWFGLKVLDELIDDLIGVRGCR